MRASSLSSSPGLGRYKLCIEARATSHHITQMRTVYGDHARFEQTYFSRFDGAYFTGDGCRRDADGYYWITGRTDDVLNVRLNAFSHASHVTLHCRCLDTASAPLSLRARWPATKGWLRLLLWPPRTRSRFQAGHTNSAFFDSVICYRASASTRLSSAARASISTRN